MKKILIILTLCITVASYPQAQRLYQTRFSFVNKTLILNSDATYTYTMHSCMVDYYTTGRYITMPGVILLTSYKPTTDYYTDTTTPYQHTYHKFGNEEFTYIQRWLIHDEYITLLIQGNTNTISDTLLHQLQPYVFR